MARCCAALCGAERCGVGRCGVGGAVWGGAKAGPDGAVLWHLRVVGASVMYRAEPLRAVGRESLDPQNPAVSGR